MSADEDEFDPRATAGELSRRRAVGLAVWSTGAALAGSVAASISSRGTRTSSPLASSSFATGTNAVPPRTAAFDPSTSGSTATASKAAPPLRDEDLVVHVARRASFGATPTLLEEIHSIGVDAWIDQQLQPSEITDGALEEKLRRLHDLNRDAADFRARKVFGDQVTADLRVAAVLRAVQSNRHLQEVMVDLWHDHLTASSLKEPVAWYLPLYDRAAIRPHALGRFADLLRAATTSGAMLEYLDTASSSAPLVNENHARELLELHTVGRSAGYSQADVTGAARVLSGWTIEPDQLTVVFDATRHDPSPATVLGWSTPGHTGAAAARDLPSLLTYLASHPATATRIATLLARRFIGDEPSDAVVASIADAYLAAGTDLRASLRHLFATPEFRSGGAPTARRPFDLFAAQLRATEATLDVPNAAERVAGLADKGVVEDVGAVMDAADPVIDSLLIAAMTERPIARSVIYALGHNGQPLFSAPNPSGHPIVGARWTSGDALLRRWTLSAQVAQDGLAGISIDPGELTGGAATAGTAVDALAARCFSGPPVATTRRGALAAMGRAEHDSVDEPQLRQALAFLLAAPEMQLR